MKKLKEFDPTDLSNYDPTEVDAAFSSRET